jgi:very-short-patch-repair endonuclease
MKYYKDKSRTCTDCNKRLDPKVFQYAITHFDIPLCFDCQQSFKSKQKKATPEARELFFALKQRGVPAELEKFDGHKTIDISVVEAMVNIEVDGGQHNYDGKQALCDLQRTLYSFKKGWLTLRIPNSLIKHNLEQAADHITEFLQESADSLETEWEVDF